MKKHLLTFGLLLTAPSLFGQTAPPEYFIFIKQADSLYTTGDYLNSGLKYTAAFQLFGDLNYANDRYDAACSWALAGNADSAFYQLQYIADNANFADYQYLSADADLISLHADSRWLTLLLQVQLNKEKSEETYNKPLLALLDSMATEDQKWRNLMIKQRNGEPVGDTLSTETINRQCILTDSLNYYLLQEIFAKYGFPGYDIAGQDGAHNFWLLVQHQDRHPAFQDSVLTKMKIAVNANQASGQNYAYLVDRVKINTGQQQVYGTQMELNEEKTSFIPKNVIDPDHLNERRSAAGLDSIESYIDFMNQVYSGSLKKK